MTSAESKGHDDIELCIPPSRGMTPLECEGWDLLSSQGSTKVNIGKALLPCKALALCRGKRAGDRIPFLSRPSLGHEFAETTLVKIGEGIYEDESMTYNDDSNEKRFFTVEREGEEASSSSGNEEKLSDEKLQRSLGTSFKMGFALIIGQDSESKKVMDCIRPKRELSFLAQSRDSISYKSIMPYILKHVATSTVARIIIQYLQTAYPGMSYQKYQALCFKHMEIDFQYAMGSTSEPRNTLSSEYMALVLKEWEMADREATGFLTMDEFIRFHYRMCLLHKIPSWKMDPYLLCYIKRQFPEGRVSFREFCLYAEDGESYVDNVKEITKRLVESGFSYEQNEKAQGEQLKAYEEESFLSYFTRCAEHMEVDYQLLYVSKELSANNMKERFRLFAAIVKECWLRFDSEKTGYLSSLESTLAFLDCCVEATSRASLSPREAESKLSFEAARLSSLKSVIRKRTHNHLTPSSETSATPSRASTISPVWKMSARGMCLSMFSMSVVP